MIAVPATHPAESVPVSLLVLAALLILGVLGALLALKPEERVPVIGAVVIASVACLIAFWP